jgi:hypothetical protein
MAKLNSYLQNNPKDKENDLGAYGKEVKEEGFNHGPTLLNKATEAMGFEKPGLQTAYPSAPGNPGLNINPPFPGKAKVIGGARMAQGGIVEIPEKEFINEHERLIPQLEGEEKADQKEELKDVRGYAKGGFPGYDVDSGDTTTVGMPPQADFERPQDASYTPKSLDLNDLPINQASGPIPGLKAPQIVPQAPPPAQKLPGMPADVNPDEIANYIQSQKKQIGKYGPEQQMELQNQLTNQRNSFGNRAISGVKGFSDALMQGVARAGNPGNQQAFENQLNEQGNQQMGTLARAGEMNMQQIGANRQVDMLDPKSEISKAYQNSFAPVFAEMGIPAEKVAKMSASQIATVAEISSKSMDFKMQQEMKKAMLEATIGNQKASQQDAREVRERQAAVDVIKGSKIPFVGPSHTQKQAAYKKLSDIASGNGSEKFDYESIPSGSKYTAPDGSTRTKK